MELGRLGHGVIGLLGLGAGAGLTAAGVEAVKAADTHRAVYQDGYGGYGGFGGGFGGGGYGNYGYNDAVEQTTNGVGIGLLTGGAIGLVAGGAYLAKAFHRNGAIPLRLPELPR